MLGIDSSRAALAMSGTALFVALGGTAVAVTKIGTKQIKNSAITSSKIKNGAVTGGKLANGAVGSAKLATGAVTGSKLARDAVDSSKVRDGSLSAADLAPNTFLAVNGPAADSQKLGGQPPSQYLGVGGTAADSQKLGGQSPSAYLGVNGTAADSQKLGGQPPSQYLGVNGTAADSQKLGGLPADQYTQGRGSQVFRRAVVPPGGSLEFLSLGFATLTGSCSAGNVPQISFSPSAGNTNYLATVITAPSTVSLDSLNGLGSGDTVIEPNASGNPQMITIRDAYNDGVLDHVATAVATGEFLFGTGCVFTGQGLTTG